MNILHSRPPITRTAPSNARNTMCQYLLLALLFLAPVAAFAENHGMQPDLTWWTVQNHLGGPARADRDTTDSGTWIGTLRLGRNPTQVNEPVRVGREEARGTLKAWVKHPSSTPNPARLVPRKDGYTIPPGPAAKSGISLLGASRIGPKKRFSGSSTTVKTMQYPKAIIATRNPCRVKGAGALLSLNLPDIPLEIIPLKTLPGHGFLKAAFWTFVFEVRYRGRPLAQCPVTVHIADDRTLTMATDENGTFAVTSQEGRPVTERWEHYLFSAVRLDPKQDIAHTATLRVVAPPPTFGAPNVIRQALYLGVALAMLVFAAVMTAVALTPDSESKKTTLPPPVRNG